MDQIPQHNMVRGDFKSRIRKILKKPYKRVVDNKMRDQGDTDLDKRVIRVNKKKSKKMSSVLDTIVHEEKHRTNPKMHEKTVYKKVKGKLKMMGKKAKQKMYAKYKKAPKKKKSLTSGKARQILKDKSVRGHALTGKQKRFFGLVAGGGKPRRVKRKDGDVINRLRNILNAR